MAIAIIIIILVCIIVGITILEVRRSPESKGNRGENTVANILGDTIFGQQYVINNLLFADDYGHSCQIDHIYINQFGIWVIETKNYSGTIYGNPSQREWTQVLAYGNVKNKLYNPIKQNATHIYRLSEYLNVKNIFLNVVVFLNNADISNIAFDNIYSVYSLPSIKRNQNTGIHLSTEQMEFYYNKLTDLKTNSRISQEQHIHNIYEMRSNVESGVCPRCGGNLVLRNGRNGQFIGCSGFPKCKFTKDLDN